MQKIWKRKTTIPGSDLYLHVDTCSLTAVALPPSVFFFFFLFHFVLGGNKFNMASKTTTTVNACTLLCKYKPRLELPEFSAEAIESAMQKMKLWQWVVPRLRHVPQKTNRTGHILDWKTNEPQSMSRNISDHSFLSHNFCIFIYVSLLQILVRQIHANHTSKRVWYIIAPNFYIFFYIFYIYI